MRVSCQPIRLAALAALMLTIFAGAVLPPPAAVAVETVQNAAGRYDGLALRDLGGRQAALVQLVAGGGTFTPVELWRSKKGAFDVRKATFVAGDVNGDGIGDGIVLYDLGRARSRLYLFVSDGIRARQTTAWTSQIGALARARSKLAVTDVNRDGRDDLVVLYDRGHASAAMYRFVSTGTKFRQTTAWSARRGTFSCARAQLGAGDVTGDRRGDAVVLYTITTTISRLDVFVAGSSRFTKKTFWRGTYPAGRAKLAVGDADSDGDFDAICLYRKLNNTGRLDVFVSSRRSFAAPSAWYNGAGGPLPATNCRFAVGDVTGDGRADAVIAQPTGDVSSSLTTCVSSGSSFAPQVWWDGAWVYPTLRLGIAPSPGLVVSEKAEVLDTSSMRALRAVSAGGTFTFAGETAQLGRVRAGDVLLAAPDATFPGGICRKVMSAEDVAGRLVVTTAQATLADVIDQGEVAFDKRITRADVSEAGITAAGVRLKTDAAPPGVLPGSLRRDYTEGFGFDVTTTIAEKVEIEGSVWLDPRSYVDWDVDWTGVHSVAFTQTLTTTTDLSVSLKASINKEIKQTIYKEPLAAITIMVGPVPVVIVPEFEIYVGASGEATAGITAGVSMTTETAVGVTYDEDGGWSHTQSYTRDLTWQKPQLFGGLELKGFLGAGLSFKLYDVLGPYAKVEVFDVLEANTAADSWWTLKAGLDAEIGVKVEALDITLLEVGYTLHLFEYVIDQAGSATSGGGSSDYHPPSVRGAVFDAGDVTPVKSALVELREGAGRPDGPLVDEIRSAGDGGYVFSGIAAGDYTVVASKDGYAQNSRGVTVVDGQTTLGQDVSIARYSAQGVSGKVTMDPGGAPVPSADVSLRQVGEGWFGFTEVDSVTANDDGTFRFTGVPPGDYFLYATNWGYECFSDRRDVTVIAGTMTSGQDLHLVAWAAQGLSGRVVSALDGSGVAGAAVELHAGGDAPAGYLERLATTAADGTYAITGVDPGMYTLVATKQGYVDAVRGTSVARATLATGQDLEVAPFDPGGLARPVDANDFLRGPAFVGVADDAGSQLGAATFEVWFRPAALYVTHHMGMIAQVSYWYGNFPGGGSGISPVLVLGHDSNGVHFRINENDNHPPGQGVWHEVSSATTLQIGQWYHIAAQYGAGGMKLYIDGHLEGSDPYAGHPEPDWSDGTLAGGWVSVGDNGTYDPNEMTAVGAYKELRVSASQRYGADFAPADPLVSETDTVLLDHLIGGTVLENHGFVWVP